jgi:hypothetical protein
VIAMPAAIAEGAALAAVAVIAVIAVIAVPALVARGHDPPETTCGAEVVVVVAVVGACVGVWSGWSPVLVVAPLVALVVAPLVACPATPLVAGRGDVAAP